MKVAGIIAEYNPFHNGHALLIEKARRAGATHVVAVMSGNFVQRGECAMFHHRERTKAALLNGVDLVIQLPAVYAVSGAQSFARAGVELLDSLGFVDMLVFGSECGDISKLTDAAATVYSSEVQSLIARETEKGIAFAAARENALRQISDEAADIIKEPNNILGVEYIAAVMQSGSRMQPVTFRRIGAGHDTACAEGKTASASYIRECISNGAEWEKYVPANAAQIFENALKSNISPVEINKNELAVLYKMRTISKEELALAPDVSEGIENRIIAAAKDASTLGELYSKAKTKRYSHARIRRIVVNSFLGITAADLRIRPPYIRVTGFTPEGRELIKTAKETAVLPVITKAADVSKLGAQAQRIFELECMAGDIYSLMMPCALPCGEEKRFTPVNIVNNI